MGCNKGELRFWFVVKGLGFVCWGFSGWFLCLSGFIIKRFWDMPVRPPSAESSWGRLQSSFFCTTLYHAHPSHAPTNKLSFVSRAHSSVPRSTMLTHLMHLPTSCLLYPELILLYHAQPCSPISCTYQQAVFCIQSSFFYTTLNHAHPSHAPTNKLSFVSRAHSSVPRSTMPTHLMHLPASCVCVFAMTIAMSIKN